MDPKHVFFKEKLSRYGSRTQCAVLKIKNQDSFDKTFLTFYYWYYKFANSLFINHKDGELSQNSIFKNYLVTQDERVTIILQERVFVELL